MFRYLRDFELPSWSSISKFNLNAMSAIAIPLSLSPESSKGDITANILQNFSLELVYDVYKTFEVMYTVHWLY